MRILALILLLLAGPVWAEESHLIDPSRLADAIRAAEGGDRAKVPYGVLSVKVSGEAEARRVCLNSIRNSRARWEKAGRPGPWLDFMAVRWCPPSADPVGHRNWLKNVRYFLSKSS